MDIETIMKLWRECGGRQHGPHVETVTLPLEHLPDFVEKIQGAAIGVLKPPSEEAKAVFEKVLENCPVADMRAVPNQWLLNERARLAEIGEENQRLREIIDVWDK